MMVRNKCSVLNVSLISITIINVFKRHKVQDQIHCQERTCTEPLRDVHGGPRAG